MVTDEPELARIRNRIANAVAGARIRDRWTRTHCTRTLADTGRGVAHHVGCQQWPLTIAWSDTAREALPDRRAR